ncbi:CGNR zinc finger domain-containing protein [Flindersiella endophytica]
MDFLRYAERAADLVNTPLEDEDDLANFLAGRPWLAKRIVARDLVALRRLQREVRAVFELAQADSEAEVAQGEPGPEASAEPGGEPGTEPGPRGLTNEQEIVRRLNELLKLHPVSPFISGHDKQTWHLHVAERESSVAETLAAEGLMGMATVVCDLGTDRFGVCAAARCTNVFVDTSPNRSRRYCSERCSSRANVAAFRARRKAHAAAASS